MAEEFEIEIPGQGPVVFDSEDQARDYLKRHPIAPPRPMAVSRPALGSMRPSTDIMNAAKSGQVPPLGDMAVDMLRRSPQAAIAKAVAGSPLARSFTKSATAGISEPLAAGVSTVAAKAMGEDDSWGETYDRIRGGQRDDLTQMKADNPGQALLGDLLGIVAPGGAFSKAYAVTNKATAPLAKLGEKMLEKGSPALSKIGGAAMKYVVRPALRGGAAQLGYDAANIPESEVLRDGNKAINSAALGAIGDAGGESIMATAKAGAGLAKEFLPGVVRMIPFAGDGVDKGLNWFNKKAADKAAAHFKEGSEKVAQAVGADDIRTAAEGFKGGVDAVDDSIFKEYKSIVDPVMDKFSGQQISPKNMRESIMTRLRKVGAVDAKGNIDVDSLAMAGPDSAAYRALHRYSERLKQNPTLAEFKELLEQFGENANFRGSNRSKAETIIGDLWKSGRDDLLDGIENMVEQAELAKPGTKQAQQIFDKAIDVNSEAARKAANPGQGPWMQGITGKNKAVAGDALEAAQSNLKGFTDAAESTGQMTAQQIRDARARFSRRRTAMEKVLKLAEQSEPERIIEAASTKTKSGMRGSYIEDTLKELPELREPIGKVVMRNIVEKANDPKALAKIIDKTYGRKALDALFGPEVMGQLDAMIAGPETLSKKAAQLYERGQKWAVSNPQVARPSLSVPRAVLNQEYQDEEQQQ